MRFNMGVVEYMSIVPIVENSIYAGDGTPAIQHIRPDILIIMTEYDYTCYTGAQPVGHRNSLPAKSPPQPTAYIVQI